ncbi:hypothetical protein ACFWP2_02105 [Kitasatospora sp. NPDC058444]|uniref:hypothetical protein n=1 Tax=Kitasatospora sp. NPDC058444 TaxID=3346504 RepID=UPI00365E63A9
MVGASPTRGSADEHIRIGLRLLAEKADPVPGGDGEGLVQRSGVASAGAGEPSLAAGAAAECAGGAGDDPAAGGGELLGAGAQLGVAEAGEFLLGGGEGVDAVPDEFVSTTKGALTGYLGDGPSISLDSWQG